MSNIIYCTEQLKAHDLDHYYATLFVPQHRRNVVTALYAFNLELSQVCDKTNELMLGKIRLKWWYDGLEAFYHGSPPANPVALAMSETVREHNLPRNHLESLIEAYSDQLDNITPPSREAMEASAQQIAGPIFFQIFLAFKIETDLAQELASHLGIAEELTRRLLNLPADARVRRCFISQDISLKHKLDVETLFEFSQQKTHINMPAELSAVVAEIAGIASYHLDQARALLPQLEDVNFSVLLPATLVAHDLGKLKKSGFNPFDGKIKTPSFWRLLILMWAAFRQKI